MSLYINGEWLSLEQEFEVYNPANGELIARVADANVSHAKVAINAAAEAFKTWKATTAYQRSAILESAHALMLERHTELAELMTAEQGKPLKAAKNEVSYAADFLKWFAEEAKRNYGETIPSARPDQRFVVSHQPVGVVAAITPWNYPISMLTRKIAPALAAGCTVVLKPAEATPLCAIEIFKILHQAGCPPGVVNLLTTSSPAPIGNEFCTNDQVKKITFTGSTVVGQQLAGTAAANLKRVSMELGGHAPFIVFEDADPAHAAKGAALVKFLNTGQACISPNRIFVHRSIIDRFTEVLTARVSGLRAGCGLNASNTIGPLVNQQAVSKVAKQVQDARDKGATIMIGGDRLEGDDYASGNFFAPTVLSNVSEDMLIYREETFGPVAAIIPFDDESRVIEMANDTHYGLAAYIYTQNLSRALRIYEALNFGIVGINDINPTSAAAPFGGMNHSGVGREGAREGMMEYLETKLGGFSI